MRAFTPTRRADRFPIAAALLLLVLVLAACGAQGGAAIPGASEAAAVGRDAAALEDAAAGTGEEPAPSGATTGGGPESGQGNAAPVEQRIIKTGEVTVEVADVPATVGRVRALVLELGGYVGGSQAGSGDQGATLTLRVPAARFDDVLGRLRDLDGEVIAEATRESDVTRQIIDLGARIANLEASEASYRVLLERAERIEDVLAVQSRLDGVRGEIEQLEAQLQEIEGDADLSTLTVSLIPAAEPVAAQAEAWNIGSEVQGALASLVGIGQGLLNVAIWFGIVWLPVLLVLSILALLTLRAVLEVRRRLPLASEPVPARGEVPPA
ncbi:MAG TPA: DUF4349 domain-containing protein [Candidatus Limnocylindrales bacterium]|nr:DUF4349 domain-containing protein [Candidatus Limnocylindrales bacterium]